MKNIILVSFLLLVKISFSCLCSIYTDQFNLYEYDNALGIHEYEVISEIEHIDTSEIPSPLFSRDFIIRVINTYKGVSDDMSNSFDTLQLLTNSSCSVFPTIGETYISYSNYFEPTYSACQRKISKTDKHFEIEKANLYKSGNLTGKTIIYSDNKTKIATGRMKNGERHGKWKVYYPVSIFTEKQGQVLFLEIFYKNGLIKKVKNHIDEEYYNYYHYFNRQMEEYYFSFLTEKGSKKSERNSAPKDDQF